MKNLKLNQIKSNQAGFASIVIALTLVLIMALMTVAFAQLTRREQKNAINRQLSAQAYYAAESGVNDAVADITAVPTRIAGSNTNCTPSIVPAATASVSNKNINAAQGVSYSCVSIDLSPPSIVYTNVSDGSGRTAVFDYTSTYGLDMESLSITWTSNTGSNATVPTKGKFLPRPIWQSKKYHSVMELSITPFNTASFSRAELAANDFTAFGYPVSGAADNPVYNPSDATNGQVYDSKCTAVGVCTMKIINLGSITDGKSVLLHITNHYDDSDITITGLDTGNHAIRFKGAQAVVDVTGRARDVLKRIQVHVPLESTVNSFYAIQATNLCKRISTYPNNPAAPAGPSQDKFKTPAGGDAIAGDPCYLN